MVACHDPLGLAFAATKGLVGRARMTCHYHRQCARKCDLYDDFLDVLPAVRYRAAICAQVIALERRQVYDGLVSAVGIEPTTPRLKVSCSTN